MHHASHPNICTPPLKGYKKVLCLRNIMWTISLGKTISLWSRNGAKPENYTVIYMAELYTAYLFILYAHRALCWRVIFETKKLYWCWSVSFLACLFSRNCTCCEFREVIYLMATSSTGMYTYVYSIENVIHILLLCAVWTNWIHQRNRKRLGARFLTEIYASGRFSGYFGKLFVWTIRARRVFW
jgi:hypothetical protein